MRKTNTYLSELRAVFANGKDKHEANFKGRQVMADLSGDAEAFSEILRRHLEKPYSLNTLHYPVVSMDIESNEEFTIVANCWIPLPDKNTNISTKAIHHHGDMLLTTATAFGTGYEHWAFETPSLVDRDTEIYDLKVLEKEAHSLNHVAFVDAYIAHLPFYPPDLTITYALWSSRFPTTWKDKLKRMPLFQQNANLLRNAASKVGLAKQLELKVVEYFDFYPCASGFKGIKNRDEFARTNNEDYLASLFHIIQETGNESMATVVKEKLATNEKIDNRELAESYIEALETGRKIEGRVSPQHFGIEEANFTKEQIIEALSLYQGKSVSAV